MRHLGAVAVLLLLVTGHAHGGTGDLDPTFGIDGTSNLPGAFEDALVLLDDKVLVLGSAFTGMHVDATLTRYTKDGMLDAAFGGSGTGVRYVPVAQHEFFARALLRQTGGRVLGVGVLRPEVGFAAAGVLGFLPDGTLDPGFATGGVLEGAQVDNFSSLSATVLPDDRIVVMTTDLNGTHLARYLADGTPDATFGAGGVATDSGGFARLVRATADGHVVVAGGGPVSVQVYVARFDGSGALDPTFGTGGRVLIDVTPDGPHVEDLVVFPNGSVFTAGVDGDQALLIQLDANGSPDPAFGTAGLARWGHFALRTIASRVVRDPEGRLLILSRVFLGGGNWRLLLARFHADGTLDATFGNGGRTPTVGTTTGALGQQSDGRAIVSAGASQRFETACPPLPDGDGDGLGDACDPCTGGGAATTARLAVTGDFAASDGGLARLAWRARAPTLLTGFAPDAYGPVLLIEDANGDVVQSTWLPFGQFLGTTGQASWKTTATRFSYKDRGQPAPRADGIVSLRVKQSSGGLAKVVAKVKDGFYRIDPAALPLRATLVLTPPHAGGDGCVTSSFAPGACTISGSRLLCP